jgi:hypothetical protein
MSYLDILDQYAGLLVVQYKTKPKAQQTVKLIANTSACDGLPLALRDAFVLDTAYGEQLSVIGRIVGVPRNILGLDLQHVYFTVTRYSGTPASIGFLRYTSGASSTLILRYAQNATYVLSDAEMLAVIRLKIIANSQALTYADIQESLYNYFSGAIYIKRSASLMQIDYYVATRLRNAFTAALFIDVVPRPMGVSINTNYI